MADTRYQDKAWLEEKYLKDEWSAADIGKFCGTSKQTISRWLGKHDIPTRTTAESLRTIPKQFGRDNRRGSKREEAHESTRDYIRKRAEAIKNPKGQKPQLTSW